MQPKRPRHDQVLAKQSRVAVARHGLILWMVERGDKGLATGEGIDQNAIPIAAANEIALRGRKQARRTAHFCGGFGERLGITNIGGLAGALFAKFRVAFFVLGFDPKLQRLT